MLVSSVLVNNAKRFLILVTMYFFELKKLSESVDSKIPVEFC